MEQIIKIILLGVLGILELMLYFVLTGTAAPMLLKNHCAIRKTSDRGLKKYVYPSGRGIAYEPHPSIRKYVPRYLLFTEDGYKYVRCQVDDSVQTMAYSVVMFDRRNRAFDVIDVTEERISGARTTPVMLHPDTSYIALILDTVNDDKIPHEQPVACHWWQLGAYGGVIGLLSFFQMVLCVGAVRYFDNKWIHSGLVNGVTNDLFIVPALLIGACAALLALRHHAKKGVRWSI